MVEETIHKLHEFSQVEEEKEEVYMEEEGVHMEEQKVEGEEGSIRMKLVVLGRLLGKLGHKTLI